MSEEFYAGPEAAPTPKQGGRPSWMWPVIVIAVVAILVPVILLSRAPAQSDEITLSMLNDKLVAISTEQENLMDRLISLEGEMGGLAGTVGAIETHLGDLEGILDFDEDVIILLDELTVAVTDIQGSLDEIKGMLVACNCTAPEEPEA
ncbi:MAG: hypothetical protein R6U93_00880 [Dehalococcoidia bacterium]